MTRPAIEEVIIVEGKSDTQALQRAVIADTIETNGSALSPETLARIALAARSRGAIVLTDPDFNGQRLRELITQAVPTVKHAFITRGDGRAEKDNPHQSLGVEHATPAVLQAALAHVMSPATERISDITAADLAAWGLLGGPTAKQRRQVVGEALQIGYANGKQLLKRLHSFGIQKAQVQAVLQEK